jgi:hypothetical protein
MAEAFSHRDPFGALEDEWNENGSFRWSGATEKSNVAGSEKA